MNDALIVFTPSGKRGRFALGTPVLTAARQLGVDINSVCGGRAICGRCQVTVGEGSFAKHGITSTAEHLTAFSATEQRYQGKRGSAVGRRLSCQAQLQGDIVIDVPADSQVHKQVIRKRAEVRAIELDTLTRLYYVEVEEPDMHKQRGDFERVEEALQAQWGLGTLSIDLGPLRDLQKSLRKGGWTLTVAVHKGERIMACWPGFHDTLYGIAVDIGSTTIAAHLCDLHHAARSWRSSGLMNPQIRFGEDLMSRVSYAMMNPGGEVEMTAAVRSALNALVGELCAEAKTDPRDVLELVFVGNPIMHHLLLGIDPVELGGAPFALATDSALELLARELELTAVNAGARVYILPCIAGHVGADCAGVVLVGDALPERGDHPRRRRRHQCRDRAGQPRPAARLLVAHRPRVRGCADRQRPACGAGGDRAGTDRPRDAGAALQGHRLRPLVRRAGLRRGDRAYRRHRYLWLGDHRGPGRDVSRGPHHHGWCRRREHGRAERRGCGQRAGRSATCSRPASPRSPSARTTSAPSSWPRPRSTPAPGC